jgi:hypothetical protein
LVLSLKVKGDTKMPIYNSPLFARYIGIDYSLRRNANLQPKRIARLQRRPKSSAN